MFIIAFITHNSTEFHKHFQMSMSVRRVCFAAQSVIERQCSNLSMKLVGSILHDIKTHGSVLLGSNGTSQTPNVSKYCCMHVECYFISCSVVHIRQKLKCGLLIICLVWYLLTNVCPAYEVVFTYKSTVSLMMVMC